MKRQLLIPIHSTVDIITNSSSELFTLEGNKEIVTEFIKEELKNNDYRCSGNGGDWSVNTLVELIIELMNSDNMDYMVNENNLPCLKVTTDPDEKFNLVLEKFIKHLTTAEQTIIKSNINNLLVIDMDNGYYELIENLQTTFPNYIRLD